MKTLAASVLATATASLGLALLVPAGTALANHEPGHVEIDLYAVAGTTSLPNGTDPDVVVNVWGYNTTNTAVSRPGGPTLEVTEGDTVSITLHNTLDVKTALLFRGQQLAPDLAGVPAYDGATVSTANYTFTAADPGTYLYEAGLLPGAEYQSSMGLYGALVVNPSGTPGQAYAAAETAYNQDEVLVLSEIDPALNALADPSSFDMRNFKPRYSLINGQAHPDIADINVPYTADDVTDNTTSKKVLLRYVNAGTQYRSMAALGAGQGVIALDGHPLNFARRYVAETFGPGQTADALITTPDAGRNDQRIAVYDGSLLLHNSRAAGSGGMLTFLKVAGTVGGGDVTGPATSDVAYTNGVLTATIDDSTTGNGAIQAAEAYLDDPSSTGTPIPMDAQDGGFGPAPSDVVTVPTSTPTGKHILYVRGQDEAGNWGQLSSVLVDGGDATGPATSAAKLRPNPSNGSAAVKVSATADDTDTGGSTIQAAEYTIDAVPPVDPVPNMTVNKNAVIASIDATISQSEVALLSEGVHTVYIRSQDSADNWGGPVQIDLLIDQTGPNVSNVLIAPNPNNGKLPFEPASLDSARLTADVSDPLAAGVQSDVRVVEGFIDTVGTPGTGFRMTPVDGNFDSPTEAAYLDVPLTTIRQLSNGEHTLYVRAKDRSKNWGPTSTGTLVVDKRGPVINSVTATPNPTNAPNTVDLTAEATDDHDVIAGEWWRGVNPGTGNGNVMTVSAGPGPGVWTLTGSVDVPNGWSPGTYRIKVRAQDSLGNWGRRGYVLLEVN